ncbi:MAG TPA: zonular occludens toxin domain-containing protein [Nitrospira sp.]|nr:zonular occludens toxin domain-containing protein [Nitrospira sp.]HNM20242.1 zonular occludens toxin domain-containing protein [Nitrospira sp.]
MIELYEGVPGSGKSYHAICEKFLPWVKQGRRLYIAVDGIYLDRLSLFTGIELQTLEQQITIWKDSIEVLQAFPHVEPGSAVIIDEAQTVFRSMQKVEPGLLRWLETHRHYGVDILLMSQDFRQMSQGVTRLIEATVKFRKLAFVGLSKKYQGKVRGNPEDNEVIRAFVGTYSPAVYAYYSSYASAAIREEKRSHTVFKSARVAIGIAAGLFAIGLMVWRPWSSLSASKPTSAAGSAHVSTTTIGAPANGSASPLNPLGISPPAPTVPTVPKRPVRILGGAGMSKDRQGWRYLLDSGEILTAAQITGRYGLMVSEVYEEGSMRLIGEGVFYGPAGD